LFDKQNYLPETPMTQAIDPTKIRPPIPKDWVDPESMPAHMRSTYVSPVTMDWAPTALKGIQSKVLFSDEATGMSTILFKMEPGSVVPLHEHMGVEQTYVLEGSLMDHEGQAGPGEFVWRPAGNVHQAYSPNGAIILSIFMKPNRFAEGSEYFVKS